MTIHVKYELEDSFFLEVMLVANSRWTEEQKIKALTIAEAVSITEAAKQTGIPEGTIKYWRSLLAKSNQPNNPTEPTICVAKKMEQAYQEAVKKATEQAGEYIAGRLKVLANQLYNLAEKAAGKVDVAISDPEELPEGKQNESHDRDGAAWVRALVGVMAQAIDKAQLLSGKPTARPEAVNKYEYNITQRIITDPEALDLAEQLLRRAARSDTGLLRMDGERGPVDTI